MKKLILSVDEGAITGVFLQASPEDAYEKLFDRARRKALRAPGSFENGIQAIVFGAFLLEALCNSEFKRLLQRVTTSKEYAAALWDGTKRLAVQDKVLIASRMTLTEPSQFREGARKLQGILDLRNRLAHFKDNDTQLSGPISPDGLRPFLENMPDPELVTLLTGDRLKRYIGDIKSLRGWLRSVFGLRTARKRASPDRVAAKRSRSTHSKGGKLSLPK